MYWVTLTPNRFAGTRWPTSCRAIEAARPTTTIRMPTTYINDVGHRAVTSGQHLVGPARRAQVSAASTSSTSGAPASPSAAQLLDHPRTVSTMARNGTPPVQERRARTPRSPRCRPPGTCRRPCRPAGPAATAGKASSSSGSKVQVAARVQSQAGRGVGHPVGPAEAQRDRQPHVGRGALREGRAVGELDHRVHHRLRVHDDVDPVERDRRTAGGPRSPPAPLFTRVAELVVTSGPIAQVGWASACSGVTSARSARERPRNGPPEAVSTSLATSSARPPRRHWASAECSESTGDRSGPGRGRRRSTSGPPTMRDSLLASARVDPAASAARVGRRPTDPVMPLRTTSARRPATWTTPSWPRDDLGERRRRRRAGEAAASSSHDVLARDRDGLDAELDGLAGEQVRRHRRPRPARPPGTGPGAADDVDRLGADRPGGPEQRRRLSRPHHRRRRAPDRPQAA